MLYIKLNEEKLCLLINPAQFVSSFPITHTFEQGVTKILRKRGPLRGNPAAWSVGKARSPGHRQVFESNTMTYLRQVRWAAVGCTLCSHLMKWLKRRMVFRMMRAAQDSSCWQRCRVSPSSMWPSAWRQACAGFTNVILPLYQNAMHCKKVSSLWDFLFNKKIF